MPLTLEEIEKEASQLSVEERGKLALALIRSLDADETQEDPATVAGAWQAEAERRWAEIERGDVQTISGEEAFARLRRTLG
jgi:putative addiction module component (TIGR02574 family)